MHEWVPRRYTVTVPPTVTHWSPSNTICPRLWPLAQLDVGDAHRVLAFGSRQPLASVTLMTSFMFFTLPLQHLNEPCAVLNSGTQSSGLVAIAGAAAPTAMTGTAQAAPAAMARRLGRRTSIPCD